MEENIILVDENDLEIGWDEKLKVHREGQLHRAFSVFIFNHAHTKMLLQKRSERKYHSSRLWTNACCSHPRKGEELSAAVRRRMYEELGITCVVEELFQFCYREEFDNNLIEHEVDHVFVAEYEGVFFPDFEEVEKIKWVGLDELCCEIAYTPERFTSWFLIACPKVLESIKIG